MNNSLGHSQITARSRHLLGNLGAETLPHMLASLAPG